jgi:hypothetical protein
VGPQKAGYPDTALVFRRDDPSPALTGKWSECCSFTSSGARDAGLNVHTLAEGAKCHFGEGNVEEGGWSGDVRHWPSRRSAGQNKAPLPSVRANKWLWAWVSIAGKVLKNFPWFLSSWGFIKTFLETCERVPGRSRIQYQNIWQQHEINFKISQ